MKQNTDENNVQQLQDMMFAQMKRLSDPSLDLEQEIKRSQAISTAGTVIINAAKVQLDAVRVKTLAAKHSGAIKHKQLTNGPRK